jgi:hypothetical protein
LGLLAILAVFLAKREGTTLQPVASHRERRVEPAPLVPDGPAAPPARAEASEEDRRRVVDAFAGLRAAVDTHSGDCDALARAFEETVEASKDAIGRVSRSGGGQSTGGSMSEAIASTRTAVARAMDTCGDVEAFKAALRSLAEAR